MDIPIENIYFILCYAWNKLEEKNIVNVKPSDYTNILNLFSRILISGLIHLFKRGLDREYIDFSQCLRGIKGKINFQESINHNLFFYGKAHCDYDELNYNILHNQLIKATIKKLLLVKDLEESHKEDLYLIYRRLDEIDNVNITIRDFSRIRLNRNNYFYDFLLKICELIIDNIFISEGEGESKFKDFTKDEDEMARVFEQFIYNFYNLEQSEFRVRSEWISWDLESLDEISIKYLPKMKTDVTLESKNRKIILEAKYYKETLTENFGKERIKSGNLYQLVEYLRNVEAQDGLNKTCDGILLYPVIDKKLDLRYKLKGHQINVKTIDLNQNWQRIHYDMLDLIKN